MEGSIIKANASLYAMKERDEEKSDDNDDPPPPSNGAVFSKDAEAKSFHGLRRARYRGRSKVQMQVYMSSTVQNLKHLANNLYGDLTSIFKIFESWLFAAEKIPLSA